MTKIADNLYVHRKYLILRDDQGICVEGHLEIFPTWDDVRQFINMFLDSTNKKVPRIIGMWAEK